MDDGLDDGMAEKSCGREVVYFDIACAPATDCALGKKHEGNECTWWTNVTCGRSPHEVKGSHARHSDGDDPHIDDCKS